MQDSRSGHERSRCSRASISVDVFVLRPVPPRKMEPGAGPRRGGKKIEGRVEKQSDSLPEGSRSRSIKRQRSVFFP